MFYRSKALDRSTENCAAGDGGSDESKSDMPKVKIAASQQTMRCSCECCYHYYTLHDICIDETLENQDTIHDESSILRIRLPLHMWNDALRREIHTTVDIENAQTVRMRGKENPPRKHKIKPLEFFKSTAKLHNAAEHNTKNRTKYSSALVQIRQMPDWCKRRQSQLSA